MRESSKSNQYRSPKFFADYLSGAVLDIGCGNDPVVPNARPFDRIHGNAEKILDHFAPASFDTVYSSHCLEHMSNVPGILADWWALVKPGGHLIMVVPHEDLYEQGFWPSQFNSDHKATFRLDTPSTWSPVSYDVRQLVSALPGSEIAELAVQDQGFNYRWLPAKITRPRSLGGFGRFVSRFRHSLIKRVGKNDGEAKAKFADRLNVLLAGWGIPTDQTHFGALAQIQCVVRKRVG